MDPFVLMVHSTPADQVCLVVDGVVRPVTDQALGSWLRGLPELRVSVRSLVDPVVMLTCNKGAVCQRLADEVGRLVWFPHGDMKVHAGLLDPADPASGVTWASLQPAPDGSGGRFRSSWPQDAAGARVRWEYGCRFGSDPARWLVERSAVSGFPAPDGLRPYVFGGGHVRGLSYFDRRDRESRSAALNAPVLGSSHVGWTPNDAYRPGAPAPGAVARPWHSRDLGVLPFDLDDVVVVVGYFAGGRFAVYDERRDISHWETPEAFGWRLRKDLAGLGGTARVLLLTDFDAVPDRARREVARGLGGRELITVNTPSTLFLDQDTTGAPEARIALLPGNHATTVPEWTATNATGISLTLTDRAGRAPLDEAVRRERSEAAHDYARSGADFVEAVVDLNQAYLRLGLARAALDRPGSSLSPQAHAAAERRLAQARDRFDSAETRFDLAGSRLEPLGLDWLADDHELDPAGIIWAREEADRLLGRAKIAIGAEPRSRRIREARQRVRELVAESLRQGRAAEALAILRTAPHTRERSALEWTRLSQPAPVAWEKMAAGAADALRARARKVVAMFTRPPAFLEHATETQQRLWIVHSALVDRVAYRIHQSELGLRPADRKTPEDLARTLITDLGLPPARGLAGGAPPAPPATADPAPIGPSHDQEPLARLVAWRRGDGGYRTLTAFIAGDEQLRATFPLNKNGERLADLGTSNAVHKWVVGLRGAENHETKLPITPEDVAAWSGDLVAPVTVSDVWKAAIAPKAKAKAKAKVTTKAKAKVTTKAKATTEQISRLVGWEPRNKDLEEPDPGDTLEAYIEGDAELSAVFPLMKDEGGRFLYKVTREAVGEWARRWRGEVGPEKVAKWSGTLLSWRTVSNVWRAVVLPKGKAKATPEQIGKLVSWEPENLKEPAPGDTLEAYIKCDAELSAVFPLDTGGSHRFLDKDTREAVHEWVLKWRGRAEQWEVVRWSGGLLERSSVSRVWKKAGGGGRALVASGGGDGEGRARKRRKRLKSPPRAAVEAAAQAVKVAELGLCLVDVAPDGDCFYAAVLRTVPRSVWEPQLRERGKELSSDGLRQAVADAYRRLRPYDVVFDVVNGTTEDRIRTPGHWDSESGDIAVQLIPDVLGVNLQTITREGHVSSNGVTVYVGRPTYYVAYNDVDHYLATEPLAPATGQAAHEPNPPARTGATGADVPMRDDELVLPVRHATRSTGGTPRAASAEPEPEPEGPDSGSGSASAGIPTEVRESIVSLVPSKDGFATLRAALEDTLGPDVVPEDPFVRELVGKWALRMLDTTSFAPAEVAGRSGGLIAAHEVVTLYNTTHAAGFGDTGTIHWTNQAYKHVTWPASGNPARPAVVDQRLRPVVGMDGQFTWRDPEDPLFRVHSLFAGEDGEVHPALVARADEITARIGEGKDFFEKISREKSDPRLPFMTIARLRDHWTAIEGKAAVRMRNLVRTARNPARDAVRLAPLHPTPGQRVYVTKVKRNHVPSQEGVLVGSYQLCLADPPGSSPRGEWPAFTNDEFIDFYLGVLTGDNREGNYVMAAGRGAAFTVIDAESAANSTAFANSALTPDQELDDTRINAAFIGVTFTFPDITKPVGTFKVSTTILVALDNAFDPITNPFGILLPTYGSSAYKF
ncbi:hypothetical protein [Amycolatopsis japonica]